MQSRYKEISKLIIRKGTKNNPFFMKAATAIRQHDNEKGLLLQHSRKVHGFLKKQAPSFFVRQKDLLRFLRLIHELLRKHISDFDNISQYLSKEQLEKNEIFNIITIIDELKKMEEEFNSITSENDEQISNLNEQLLIKDKQIASLVKKLNEVKSQRIRIQFKEMERRLPEFKKFLNEFKNLIENGKQIAKERGVKQESLYQDFLETNFWMFGVPYLSVQRKPKSGKRGIPDLLLQRSDGFNDVVELENPTDNIFIFRSNRYEQSKELKEALAQIMDYLDDYAVGFLNDYYTEGIETYKPKGIVVIGRSGDQNIERRRRQLNSYLHGIEVWTYDDLVRNAEQVISLLERGPAI